jgi:hypothetical protein
MVELLMMLAQEILAVVVAVRRAHHRVHVVTRRLVIAQRNAALMVERDKNDRTVDAVVEHTLLVKATHLGEISRGQMLLHFCHSDVSA